MSESSLGGLFGARRSTIRGSPRACFKGASRGIAALSGILTRFCDTRSREVRIPVSHLAP